MLVFKWNLFPLILFKAPDLTSVWYEKVPIKTHLWQTSGIRKEHFFYTSCVAGSYLRKHLTWVVSHWQSRNVSSHQAPVTTKLTEAYTCSSDTAQNLQKKVKFLCHFQTGTSLWQVVSSKNSSSEHNCTESKERLLNQETLKVSRASRAQIYLSENPGNVDIYRVLC